MNILQVDSSILQDNSVSRILTADISARLKALHPDARFVVRDLGTKPLPHLHYTHISPFEGIMPEGLAADRADGATALSEFLAADTVVIGAPMYNFTIPSQLKAWIDRVVIAGQTFQYSEKGAEGLAGDKTVIIASSRGGFYSGESGLRALDHQEAYLEAVFRFLGISRIRFVRAEGLNVGPEQRAQAIEAARGEIASMAV